MKLEQHNFKIDSTGWENKHDNWSEIDYLENPEGDVWEIASEEFKGEQLFTWDGAMRETKKAGKKIPTDEQLSEILTTKSDMPNLKLAGSRFSDGSFNGLGTYAFFWSSSQSGSSAWPRHLNSGNATVGRCLYSKAYGFSVRCLKDKQPRDSKGRFKGKYEKALDGFFDETFGMLEKLTIKMVEKPNIKIELQKTTYKLSQGDFSIYASVGKKGKITIKKPNGFMDFVFEKSDPKTLKAIGELLIKASEL